MVPSCPKGGATATAQHASVLRRISAACGGAIPDVLGYNGGMYQELAPYYDELFPASGAAVSFLEARCPEGGAALDIACGTGSHALALARRSRRVVGVDLDRSMIELAVRKAGARDVAFLIGDMTKLDSCPEALGPFDLIYCIGNSIVHLPDRESVSIALASCRDRLIPHGAVVIQIINFELVKNGAVPELPPLHSKRLR